LASSLSYSMGSEIPGSDITSTTPAENSAVFEARFSRYRRLLHFIATRVLGSPERADEAVENCWLSASRNPPSFEYDGAFCSWLARVLIDEALAIRGHDQETNTTTLHSEHATSSPSDLGKLAGTFAGGTQ
jgi:DNA-directed RNA polymerase specialized sigma24 family protein